MVPDVRPTAAPNQELPSSQWMVTIVRRTELSFKFMNRPVRPFSFALLIATIAVAYQYLIYDGWPYTHTLFVKIEGGLAVAAFLTLFVAWWMQNERMHEVGLMLCTALWAGRASLYVLEQGWGSPGVWLSLAWAVGAAGAWGLECYKHRWRFGFDE